MEFTKINSKLNPGVIMGWLGRIFGIDQKVIEDESAQSLTAQYIPAERVGLRGEYDLSGLAKRVAAALDREPEIDDIPTLYISQAGTIVVFTGKAPDRITLSKIVQVASRVYGASVVDTRHVEFY